MKKQLELFPELDLSSKEPIIYDGASGQLINKFKEKEVGPFETALNNVQNKGKEFLLENQMQYHQKQKQFRNLIMAELLLKKLQGREFAQIRAFVIRV